MGSSLPNHDAKEQKGQTEKRQKTKTKEKPKGKLHQTQLEKNRNITIYMMHEQNQHMMHALMPWEKFNYTLKFTKLAWG